MVIREPGTTRPGAADLPQPHKRTAHGLGASHIGHVIRGCPWMTPTPNGDNGRDEQGPVPPATSGRIPALSGRQTAFPDGRPRIALEGV